MGLSVASDVGVNGEDGDETNICLPSKKII